MKLLAAICLVLMAAAGCHQERLPTYPRVDEASTLKLLAERSAKIRTVSGSGTLELTPPGGDGVRLDVAVAMQPPDHARLRAWKFGAAVFDLTLTPDGLWLESSRGSAPAPQKEKIKAAGINAGQVARAWALMSGGFFEEADLVARADGARLTVRRVRHGEPVIVCDVDRDTLTARRYQMLDDAGHARLTLTLGEYRDFKGLTWPRRITAISEAGRVVVDLGEVELNEELSAGAFKPPGRAEKLP